MRITNKARYAKNICERHLDGEICEMEFVIKQDID